MADADTPICPDCGQPASQALGGSEHAWECRNEACPEYGQVVDANELPPPGEPSPRGDRGPDR